MKETDRFSSISRLHISISITHWPLTMSIFLPLVDFFQQHAFLWDSLKFMAAGMFFDLTRRWSSSILDIVMECEQSHHLGASGLADNCSRYGHRGDILW